jgi:hypothetical protein
MRPDADPAVKWLLSSADPSVRYLTLTEVCGISPDSPPAAQARRALGRGPRVRALLAGQRGDGGFGYVQSRRAADGLWRADGRWWRPAGRRGRGPADVADRGARGPNEMITLNALAVLTAAARR